MSAPSITAPTRVFIVGTDTAVGKTAVTAALLHTARARGLRVVPYKPAQSGSDRPSDAERLLAAAGLPADELALACPLRHAAPLAPGLAEDPSPFLTGASAPFLADTPPFLVPGPQDHRDEHLAAISRSVAALAAWEARHQPSLTLIEGAGGLYVPMPAGTWQPAWIAALAPWTLVVGRAGLGTINHCLTTIAGLRALGRPPLGFVLSQTSTAPDPSVADNAAVIANASGIPHLGTLPHGPEPALAPAILDALLARLGR
jgi:dethiobiotin synthetase